MAAAAVAAKPNHGSAGARSSALLIGSGNGTPAPKLGLKRPVATPNGKKSGMLAASPLSKKLFSGDEGTDDATMTGGSQAASSSGAQTQPTQPTQENRGRNRGRGRNRNFKEKVKLDGATLAEQVKNLTAALVMTIRLVCAHAQEFRRLAKEGDICLLLERKSHAPGRLNEAQQQWRDEIPPKDEANPFPTNNDGPWRFRAFQTIAKLIQQYVEAPTTIQELEEDDKKKIVAAAETLNNKNTVRRGLQRFWRLKSLNNKEEAPEDDSGDKDKEIWLLRFAPKRAQIRQDHARKGGLQRALEGILEPALGKKGAKGGQEGAQKE